MGVGSRWLAASALWMPLTAMAQPLPITIDPNEAVVITIDADGPDVIARSPAQVSPYERAVLARTDSGAYVGATGKTTAPFAGGNGAAPTRITPGRLLVKFVKGPKGDLTLFVENGYARALRYRAHIFRDDVDQTTDVCLVAPGRRGVEHWPYPLDRIEISRIRLVDWKPGDSIPCG